jgi:lysine 6-dehydrogenase
MRVLFAGCGRIGSIAAEDFARSMSMVEVIIADKYAAEAREVAEKIGLSNVSWIQLDASNHTELVNTLTDFDLIIGFLPGGLGYRLVEACIDAGRDLVDVSYMPEEPVTLDGKAVEAGVTVVPDCGLAPGISNVLVGHAVERVDKVSTVHVMVGGLPEKPVPPLGYIITWSPENLIDEYTRRTRIVRNGETVDVETLSGLEEVDFPNVGTLEAFYTDGLRTLLHTVKNVDDMWEKTLRYPGHAEKIRLLKALDLFDEERVSVDGADVSPREFTVKLFERKLWRPEIRDIVAMKIEVSGFKDDKHVRYVYHLLDRYDENQGVTAMARTTAYPASITAQLMLKKVIKENGVIPLERLGMNEEFFSVFMKELENRKIRVVEEVEE